MNQTFFIFNLPFHPCFPSFSLSSSPLSSSSIHLQYQYQLLSSSSTASTPAASCSMATPPYKILFSFSQTRPPFPSDVFFTLLKSPQDHLTQPTSFPSLPPSFSPFLPTKIASLAMGLPSYLLPPPAWMV